MTPPEPTPPNASTDSTAGDQPEETPSRVARARQRADRTKARVTESSAGDLWQRLNAMDFINRGMLFAAVLLLCFFPFLIVANSLLGRSSATTVVRHLGLNHQAAVDVGRIFNPPSATTGQLAGAGYVLFILGGIAAATAVQGLYEAAFGVESRGFKDVWRRLLWLALLFAGTFLASQFGKPVRDFGGPVLLAIIGLVLLTGFFWLTMWFLLGGRVPWEELLPSAIATAVCWVGMEIVFSLVYSSSVINDYKKYGGIGVVIAMMSYLIAIAVVIILGAIAGQLWRERRHPSTQSKDPSSALESGEVSAREASVTSGLGEQNVDGD
jgi:membrane protein